MPASPLEDLRRWGLVARGFLRPQRLALPAERLPARRPFAFSEALFRDWQAFFGLEGDLPGVPLLYHSALNAEAMHAALDALGVNFGRVLHLRSELSVPDDFPDGFLPGRTYVHEGLLEDVALVHEGRAVIVFRSAIADPDGRVHYRARDFFSLGGLSPRDAATIRGTDGYNRTDVAGFSGLSRLAPRLAPSGETRVLPLPVTADLGVRYGRVSGDLNWIHTSDLVARLLGFRRAFAQGLATMQLAMVALGRAAGEPPRGFGMTFCRPLYLGQTAALRERAGELEVVDAAGALVAIGAWRARSLDA